jgi:uncharacterized protein
MADTSKRGFASMDPSRQREIASKGGRAAHAKGTAHEFTSEEARQAGKKGGESVSRNRAHMAAIGRKGGESRSANRSKDEMRTPAFGSTASERTASTPQSSGNRAATDSSFNRSEFER